MNAAHTSRRNEKPRILLADPVLEDEDQHAVGGADRQDVEDDRLDRDHDRPEREEQEQERQ